MDSVNQGLKGHLVMLTIPAWGSLRPLCGFACRAVQERLDIVVTFMTLGGLDEKIAAECNRYRRLDDDDEEKGGAHKRLRLVNIGGQGFDVPELIVQSTSTGDDIPPTTRPTAVITDYNFVPILRSVREITGGKVPIWNWSPIGAYLPLRIFGPEKYGGLGDVADKARHVAVATGRDVREVTKEMTNMKQGNLVILPGLPAFYDYEWYPFPDDRYKDLPVSFYDIFKTGVGFMKECDAFIYDTCSAYEPEAINATRRWLEESGGRKLYAIGPIFPWPIDTMFKSSKHDLLTTNHGILEYDTPVQAFMDRILASHGENSLLYISFGSMLWPGSDYVRLYVEILLEHEIPFIFAIASPYADLPTELIDKMSSSGFSMVSKWCPQQMILSHPVTGWFLSHCGHNSTLEALSQGVPMIAWPLMFDQPGIAAYISLSLDVAFELIQVRTGIEGLKPLHRGGSLPVGTCESVVAEARDVLQRIKGSEGERKRRNSEAIKNELSRAWKNGGDSLEDFKKLLCDAIKESPGDANTAP